MGWLLVAEGCRRLGARAPALLALVTAVLSVNEVVLPARWQIIDRATGEDLPPGVGEGTGDPEELRFDDLTGLRLTLLVLCLVAGATALWLGAPLVAAAAAVVTGGGYDPVWDGAAWYLALDCGVAALATAGLLCRVGDDRRWAEWPGAGSRV